MTQPPRFTWKTADGASHEYEMVAAEIAIGRAPTCDIVLNDDQMVSRRHCIVRKQGNVVTIVDLGSSNGTLINGNEIHDAATLKDGDRLTIGDHDLMFAAASESVSPAPATNPVVETIRIGGNATPVSGPTPAFIIPTGAPAVAEAEPDPYAATMMPAATYAPPPPAPVAEPMPAFSMGAFAPPEDVSETSTEAFGVAADAMQSSYVHVVNGKEVEREESSARSYQSQVVAETQQPPATKPDAAMLLATIQSLHDQLNDQIVIANDAADRVRADIRVALSRLQSALAEAQSTTQRTALADLRQLADSVGQSQRMDQAASLAMRATEIRDVLVAHQNLLDALTSIRAQLESAVN